MHMIDLHTHTNHSDGTSSVYELLKEAEDKKLDILSITDHDKIGAYLEMDENPDIRKVFKGDILIGSELKTFYDGVSIEVLAYGFDYHDLKIHKVDRIMLQNEFLNKFKKILNNLGFKYDLDELYIDSTNPAKYYAGSVVAREILRHPENKKLIEEIGEFTATSFFREHQSNVNSVFYIDESPYYSDIFETIERIHLAGGLAFLAHGYIYPFKDKDATIENILRTTKIDGMECVYPLFSDDEVTKAFALTEKYNKYRSGGSDYHGKNKPDIHLGENNNRVLVKSLVNDWTSKCQFYK